MIILPAIDIIDGKPVRLYQGDYEKKEIVAASVLDTAKAFEKAGAEYIHLVDLDGAKAKKPMNDELIIRTANAVNIPVEVGGGIRSMEAIENYLENGVSRIILGTSALSDEELLKEALARYPGKIAVGIDARNGKVCTEAWMEGSGVDYLEFASHMEELGVPNLIFTDISRDGTLQGPNLAMLTALQDAVNCDITASGGIACLEDIQNLADLDLYGAITGKAMYSGSLDLKEAIQTGKDRGNR